VIYIHHYRFKLLVFWVLLMPWFGGFGQNLEPKDKVHNFIHSIPGVSGNQLESVFNGQKSVQSILPLIEKLAMQDPNTCALVVNELLLHERVKHFTRPWAILLYFKTKVELDRYLGNEELAILKENIEQCVAYFTAQKDVDWLVRCLNLQADVLFHLSYNKNDSLFVEASSISARVLRLLQKDQNEEGKSYGLYGEIYRIKGNICMQKVSCPLDSVLHYYDDALEYFTLNEDRSGQSKILINKAIALSTTSKDSINPEYYYQKAIKISESVNDQYHAYLKYAIYLQNKYLETADPIWTQKSNELLDKILSISQNRRSEVFFQKAVNMQSLLAYTADDISDDAYERLMDTVVHLYRKTFEYCKDENNAVVYNEMFDRLVTACPYFPEENCTEILTMANELKSYFLKKNKSINEEITRRNEAFRIALEEQRRKQLWLGFVLVGLVAILFFVYFTYRQKIRNLNTTIEIKQEALRAQMNPHFISNTINAIESLVNQGKNDRASDYLIDFSRLCRLVINQSRVGVITLKEELETLNYFLSLEKLRLGEDLKCHIAVDPQIKTDHILIPPLILQPFVENAIWHGIKNKSNPKEGILNIKINRLTVNMMECIVEDNGVGRQKSKEFQAASVVDQKSWGTTLTNERIWYLNKDKKAELEIIDLYDAEGNPSGTRVKIILPIRLKK